MSGEISQLTSQMRAVKKEDLGDEMADRRMNEQMDQDQTGKNKIVKHRLSHNGQKKDIKGLSNFKKQKIEYQTPKAKCYHKNPHQAVKVEKWLV